MSSRSLYLVLFLSLVLSSGCSFNFGFSPGPGAQNPNLNTIAVRTFSNESELVVAYLSQEFTESLQDEFLRRSRLALTTNDADVEISGTIINYSVTPSAISSGETAAQNRLTISIRVIYDNRVEPGDNWEKTFTKFSDFDATQNFASVERDLIEEVNDQLVAAIFNEVFGKW